ncbi:SIMPL domain-containing protein [Tsukamurella sp. 8F]|uniref:SIMPL domain-containing protein n=1 Tax=unclassified Tsukamurella TaxID=2633480 RepID=UPI0023B9A4A0|nr:MULTISPECIES: SIMPL domain-containing protein [unclassified Tsukamurella]MDF0532312.1 SIMPL domain-containing protein [Tsukamurella sp. 8J]MDF0589428.1 SIMPL domain-containing protein [Tsukamurella sp. 8F]
MNDVEITVRGSHRVYAASERATVALTVALEGPSPDSVYADVAPSARALADDVSGLHDPAAGAVTWWSSERLATWATRPWHKEGERPPLVHHARVRFRVKFRDFAELGRFTARSIEIPGVDVDDTTWALTEKRREALVAEVRTAAVRDARARAQAYADALGLGVVRPVAIADPGMLGAGGTGDAPPQARFALASAGGPAGGPPVSLTPEQITIEQSVDARFRLA